MSDKSNKYGYVGVDIPAQSFGSNKGVFNPAEINELVADNKWTTFGQLELIETQTASGTVEFIEFTNLQESTYNVHLLTVNNMNFANNAKPVLGRFSTDGGTSYVASGYQTALQRCQADGTFAEDKSTSRTTLMFTNNAGNGTGETANFYCYFYNLGDNTKYSFVTIHNSYMVSGIQISAFGSEVYPVANTVNAFRFQSTVTNNFTDFDISLYGIRYS